MKFFQNILGLISCFCVIIILLFTSIQAIAYRIPNYYRHEYEKYNVTETVGVEMEDLLQVTEQMMKYLNADRENLHDIKTTINGVENTPFFNEREVAHMEDVRFLFINALKLRTYLIITAIVAFILLFLTKPDFIKVYTSTFLWGVSFFFIGFGVLVFFIFNDFGNAFVIFHQILFDNDLWLLNPETDNLINIVPLGFFLDTAKYITALFIASILLLVGLCLYLRKKIKK